MAANDVIELEIIDIDDTHIVDEQTTEINPLNHGIDNSGINHLLDGNETNEIAGSAKMVQAPLTWRIIYSAILVCISSLFCGVSLTASDFFLENYNSTLMYGRPNSPITSTETPWFLSINFIGAFCGNLGINSFYFDIQLVVLMNNMGYLSGFIVMYLANHTSLLFVGKFLIGVSTGITCAVVPVYLSDLKTQKWSGMISSFHFLMISVGMFFGYLLHSRIQEVTTLILFLFSGVLLSLINMVGIFFISPMNPNRKMENIKKMILMENNKPLKSVLMVSIFLLTQQLSGINVFLLILPTFIERLGLKGDISIYIRLTQIIASLLFMFLVDYQRIKRFLIMSLIGTCLSMGILMFKVLLEICVYTYIFSFSLGIGPITWFIAGEIVPPEYRYATNQISLSLYWLFGAISAYTQLFLFEELGLYVFGIHLGIMFSFLIYIAVFYDETR